MNNQTPVTLDEISKIISENNKVLIPLMGVMMDEKIKKNNDILIPLIDKKIKDNNDILIPLIDKKIKDNNDIIMTKMSRIIDEKIGKNNDLIFEHFNDQTDRILNLFKGVIRIKTDGVLGAYV